MASRLQPMALMNTVSLDSSAPNDPQNRIHSLQYTVKTNSECWEENKEKIGILITV